MHTIQKYITSDGKEFISEGTYKEYEGLHSHFRELMVQMKQAIESQKNKYPERLLTMKQAAVYMGISFPSWKAYVGKRMMPDGTPIPIVPVGLRRINFDVKDLDKLIERLKITPMEKFRSTV